MPCEQLSASSHSARSRMLYAFPLEDRVTESRGRPGGSCTFGLSWTPAISVSMTGTIKFNDGAPNSPQTVGSTGLCSPARLRAPSFFAITAFSISLSRLRSITIFFNFVFSSRTCFASCPHSHPSPRASLFRHRSCASTRHFSRHIFRVPPPSL